MKLRGRLTKQFFGGDVWVLQADDGAQYQLNGQVPAKLEGQQVEVDAKPAKQGFGFSMVGDVLDVQKIKRG